MGDLSRDKRHYRFTLAPARTRVSPAVVMMRTLPLIFGGAMLLRC